MRKRLGKLSSSWRLPSAAPRLPPTPISSCYELITDGCSPDPLPHSFCFPPLDFSAWNPTPTPTTTPRPHIPSWLRLSGHSLLLNYVCNWLQTRTTLRRMTNGEINTAWDPWYLPYKHHYLRLTSLRKVTVTVLIQKLWTNEHTWFICIATLNYRSIKIDYIPFLWMNS